MMLASRLRAVTIFAGLAGLAAFTTPAAASVAKAPGVAVKAPGVAVNAPGPAGKILGPALTTPRSCSGLPAAVFAPWHDNSLYLAAPDGGLEAGGEGWKLTDGARVVRGGDPFALSGTLSKRALSLPSGSSATSPSTCIAKGMPTFRFTARNTGATKSRLRVTVVYSVGGRRASKPAGNITAGRTWSPVKQLSLALGQVGSATSVSFRFTPVDSTGRWLVDSLYIDPRLSH